MVLRAKGWRPQAVYVRTDLRHCLVLSIYKERERERETERQRDRDRETETETERQRQSDRDRERERGRGRERDKQVKRSLVVGIVNKCN